MDTQELIKTYVAAADPDEFACISTPLHIALYVPHVNIVVGPSDLLSQFVDTLGLGKIILMKEIISYE